MQDINTDDAASGQQLTEQVERTRRMLFEGGFIDMGADGLRAPTPAVALTLAEMVHDFDVLAWEAAGSTGQRPLLSSLLSRTVVDGRRLSQLEWSGAAILAGKTGPELAKLRQTLLQEDIDRAQPQLMPAVDGPPMFTAVDMPKLRRELVNWMAEYGRLIYMSAIQTGSQNIFIPHIDVPQDIALATAERDTLKHATQYYVDTEMCQLLTRVCPTMPPLAPTVADLPARRGFAVFAHPLASAHHWCAEDLAGVPDDLRNELANSAAVPIYAASWRPFTLPAWAGRPGVWFTFYTVPRHLRPGTRDTPMARQLSDGSKWLYTLTPENEAVFQLYDPQSGMDEKQFQIGNVASTAAWARVLLAAFNLARQPRVGQIDRQHVNARPLPKSKTRRGFTAPPAEDVYVVRLRPAPPVKEAPEPSDPATTSGRQYRHRWLVGGEAGFWRDHWYPSENRHKPILIDPFMKGPAGAPLLEKVYRVSPPKGHSSP